MPKPSSRLPTEAASLSGMPFYGHAWSPDSQRLAYLWITPPTLAPELRSLHRRGVTRLVLPSTTNVYYEPMDWSPDGHGCVPAVTGRGLALVSAPQGQVAC